MIATAIKKDAQSERRVCANSAFSRLEPCGPGDNPETICLLALVTETQTTLEVINLVSPAFSFCRTGDLIIMRNATLILSLAALLAVAGLVGCNETKKSPDVTDSIRKGLDQAGLKDVSVSQDRDKGVVTLAGNVAADADKAQAESIANSMASGQVVSDQIAVLPPGAEHDTKAENADIDKAIDKNVAAALIKNKLQHDVRYDVKNGVVTLKGTVNSEGKRAEAEKVASAVPDVHQVVNELDVKGRKATSSR